MNMMWVIEWWVRCTTLDWHYQAYLDGKEDGYMNELHMLVMLDNIRDSLWHKLDINDDAIQALEDVYEDTVDRGRS